MLIPLSVCVREKECNGGKFGVCRLEHWMFAEWTRMLAST